VNGKFGIQGLTFTDTWNEANARAAIDNAARLGFDFIEVFVTDFAPDDVAMTRDVAGKAGIAVATAVVLPSDADLSSPDREIAARGEAIVERSLEIARELGSSAVSGLIYAGLGRYQAPPTPAQRHQVIEALGRLDQKARSLGLGLGLEAVNRYETYLVNTLDEAASIIEAIGSDNMFIHLDTFHMNLEENDIAGIIARNGHLLGHAHLADNNRAMPGTGTFDFKELFRALARADYQGDFALESFSSAVVGPGVVAATASWRPVWQDPVECARQGLNFMRAEVEAAWQASGRHAGSQ
jgi:D-psicose/D-tagatose/L-ribulose 3-epimerase